MSYGLYISAEGAHAQAKRLEVIANNLANVDTVGFKRELAILQARHTEAIEQGQADPGDETLSNIGGGIEVSQTRTIHTPGPLQQTNIPQDMAIRGEGFFLVQKGDEQLLTRAGNFSLSARGELMTPQGYPVLDASGTPVIITDPQWSVTPDGTIRQNGGAQPLAIVRPFALADLARAGENLFRPLAGYEPLPQNERQVASGHLEQSAVNATSEMVEMIETSRLLEANLKLMQAQDDALGSLVNRMMRV